MSNKFVFVTGNLDKVKMLEKFLGHSVEHHELDLHEIQSLDTSEVLKTKAEAAYKILKKTILVDDVSLSVKTMGGLPGTLVKFFLKSVGVDGVCKMVDAFGDRSAIATTTFGFYDGKNFREFVGEVHGSISPEPRGDPTKLPGMGWNPIFIPAGQPKTIAEMDESQLEKYTPRGVAVGKLKKFLDKNE